MTSADKALARAMADACFGATAGAALTKDLRGWLEGHGVSGEDVEAILAAPQRLAVYRSLVRNGLSTVIARTLPRTRARLNAACVVVSDEGPVPRFDADAAAFVDQVGPRTHHVRDVPAELVTWAAPRWRADARVPAYLPDLAAFELAHFAVAASASVAGASSPPPLAVDRALSFSESTRLMHFEWAVHELPTDEESTVEPSQRDVSLLAYRDAAYCVRWLELTPLAAAILGRLLAGDVLGQGVTTACAEHQAAPGVVLDEIARLLADLGARGVLLGGRGHER